MSDHQRIFGRREERAALKSAAAEALSGGGGIVLLSGEEGIGATRLVEAFLGEGELEVFSARAHEDARQPYGLISEIIAQAVELLGQDVLKSLQGSDCLSLLLSGPGSFFGPDPSSQEYEAGELQESIAELLRAASSRGALCVFLDDLHWSDLASLDALRSIALDLQGEPVLFVATHHETMVWHEHPLQALREEFRQKGILWEVHLLPLKKEEAELLVREVFSEAPSPALLEMLLENSRGIPLYLEELASALSRSGRLRQGESGLDLVTGAKQSFPETLHDAVLLRLDSLSPSGRELAEAASVVGQDRELELVMEVAGRREGVIELFDSGLLEETRPGHVGFRHDLTRMAIRSQIAWSRRRELHRRMARALRSRNAPAGMQAEHWRLGRRGEEARRSYLQATHECCRLRAFQDAFIMANQALELWPEGTEEEERLDTLDRVSHCALESGKLKDAAQALREIAASPLLDAQPLRRAETFKSLAEVLSQQGLHDHARNAHESAAQSYLRAQDEEAAGIQRLSIAISLTSDLRAAEALAQAKEAFLLAEKVNATPLRVRAMSILGQLMAMRGEVEQGRAVVEEGLELARGYGDLRLECEGRRCLATVHEYASEYTEALRIYGETRAQCENHGMPGKGRFCAARMAWVLFRLGRWDEAARICKEALREEQRTESLRGVFEGVLGFVAAHRGEEQEAKSRLRESLRFSRRHHVSLIELLDSWALAVRSESLGDRGETSGYYRHMLALWQRGDDRHDLAPGLCAALSFFSRQDDSLQLTRCLDALGAMRAASRNPEVAAALAYGRGESTLLRGHPTAAAAHFSQSADAFRDLTLILEEARARMGLGRALLSAEQPFEAREQLMKAQHLFRLLGAVSFLKEVSQALIALPPLSQGEASS